MAKLHPKAQDKMNPFLSNIGGPGIIEVEAPNGVQTGDINNLGPDAQGYSGGLRQYGARSGTGKQLTVK